MDNTGAPEGANPRDKFRVAFVCSGNTCRSPMAAAMFKRLMQKERPDLADRVEVTSCGLGALEGTEASGHAITAMDEMGIDLRHHRSRRADAALLASADLVFTMTRAQRAAVLEKVPALAGRVYALGGLSCPGAAEAEAADIADPFGGEIEEYRRVAREISDLLGRVLALVIESIHGNRDHGGVGGTTEVHK